MAKRYTPCFEIFFRQQLPRLLQVEIFMETEPLHTGVEETCPFLVCKRGWILASSYVKVCGPFGDGKSRKELIHSTHNTLIAITLGDSATYACLDRDEWQRANYCDRSYDLRNGIYFIQGGHPYPPKFRGERHQLEPSPSKAEGREPASCSPHAKSISLHDAM